MINLSELTVEDIGRIVFSKVYILDGYSGLGVHDREGFRRSILEIDTRCAIGYDTSFGGGRLVVVPLADVNDDVSGPFFNTQMEAILSSIQDVLITAEGNRRGANLAKEILGIQTEADKDDSNGAVSGDAKKRRVRRTKANAKKRPPTKSG